MAALSNRKIKAAAWSAAQVERLTSPTNRVDDLTCNQILSIAKSKGYFSVDRYKWTKSKLRQKCHAMRVSGILVGGRHDGSGSLVWYAVKEAKTEGHLYGCHRK